MYQSDYLFYCFVKNGKEKINCLCLKHSTHETYYFNNTTEPHTKINYVSSLARLLLALICELSVVTKLFFIFLLAHLFCAFLFALQQSHQRTLDKRRKKRFVEEKRMIKKKLTNINFKNM